MRFIINTLRHTGMASVAIGIALMMSDAVLAQSPGQAPEPGWTADTSTGCKLWNPAPVPNESVTWSGACVGGFADGFGVEQWYVDGQRDNRVEGQFVLGRSKGILTVTYADGRRYIGALNSAGGGPSGFGTIIWPNGDRFEGKVVNNRAFPDGDGVWTFESDPHNLGSGHELAAWGRTLNARASHLVELGRFIEAEALAKWALEINEKLRGMDHLSVATSLINLANIYSNLGLYIESETLQKRAIVIREKKLGHEHPNVATALNNLANTYGDLGRYDEAELLHKRALAIYEKALGANHLDVATSLNNLAKIYRDQFRYGESEPLQKRALAISEKTLGSDHPDVATSLNNLAENYRYQGRYGEAELLQKRVLAIRERSIRSDHPDFATSLNNLAGTYINLGRYDLAEPLQKRALEIYEKALGADHSSVATSLDNLGRIYRNLGRYSESERLQERALAIREKALGTQHKSVAISLNNLANTYSDLGRYSESELFYNRALSIFDKSQVADQENIATSLNNISRIYRIQGRYGEAEPLQKRALAIYEKALGTGHPSVATALGNLAHIYRYSGRYDEANLLLERSLAIDEKALGPEHPNVIDTLYNFTHLKMDMKEFEYALSLLRRQIYSGFIRITLLPISYSIRQNKLLENSEALSMSMSIMQLSSVTGARDAVTKLAQRFSGGRGEQADLIRRDQDLANQWTATDKLLTAQFSKATDQRSKDFETNMRQRIGGIEAARKDNAAALAARFPNYVALTKPPVLSVADIQALLSNDEALIAFDVAEKGYTWVISRTTADWTEVPTTAATLADEVKALRSTLVFEDGKPAKPFDATLAYKIYQQTLGPLADKFAGKKRLSVYVNGALSGIPLQLLVTKDPTGKAGKDIDWLVKSAAITNLPSIYSLKASRRQLPPSAAKKPMIAFADPVFSREARAEATQHAALRGMPSFYNGMQLDAAALAQSLRQLPGTRREVEAVARSLGAGREDLHMGLQATVQAVQEAKLDQYRVVYFATHALVAGDMEQFAKAKAEPALALTFPEKPTADENGLLPASEVAQLKLDADWVVLSACNTAAGDQPGAEALSGLARAFIYAGARSLLASHWEVSDTATSSLMRRVFEVSRTQPNLSHGEALREAELRTLEAARNAEEAHPRVWAPFVVVGEPLKPGTSVRGQP